jgi:hypothetical protein
MSYQTISIKDAVHRINHSVNGWFLPAIQRPYVWGSRYQQERYLCSLFDSILNGYPIGSLILWQTGEAVPYREFMTDYLPGQWATVVDQGLHARSDKGLIYDGQQRLQTLYSGLKYTINGKILVYDLLFDLKMPHAAHETGFSFVPKNAELPWYCIRMNQWFARSAEGEKPSILTLPNPLSAGEIAVIDHNLTQLWKLFIKTETKSLAYFAVTAHQASVANEIFTRLNTGGRVLSQADLLFSKIKAVDYDFEERLQRSSHRIHDLTGTGYRFSAEQLLQVLHLLIKGTLRVDPDQVSDPELRWFKTTWETLEEPLIVFFADYLWGQFKINHARIIPKSLALLPLILYFHAIYRNGFQFKHLSSQHLLTIHQYLIKSQINDWNLQTLIDHGSREILSLSRSHSDLFAFPLATLETYIAERKLRHVEVYEESFAAATWFSLKVLMPERVYQFAPDRKGRFNPEIDHLFPRRLANPPPGYDRVVDQLWNLQPVKGDINGNKSNLHPQPFFMDLAVNSAGEKIVGSKYLADYDFLFPRTEKNAIDCQNNIWNSPVAFIQQRRRLMVEFLKTQYGIEFSHDTGNQQNER